ncbi:superfamily II DNA/RNA helicase [Agromyces flavus]|uniref:Superfamily II DNA and RNA helicase n=1 Tax=Agromyces flavus TaxID=589382 RepID=A0A1H1LIT3_9MICO|nr:DEAD/DEAH box helicase [Agromyces flavus]MCP2368522.1 superfamily II DNA/RNA helicase [Agromyces flavus]GGI48237.1 putative ATP-dependent RNA helicase [Agromyces flavus]SDR74230.1 Superfamily II DNA and RNA helicase [Agromyces flavus]
MTEITFGTLGVPAPLVAALAADGKTTPFPIQADTLPDTLAGRDVLGRGKTGSGKTIAFALPMVARLGTSLAGGRRRAGRPLGLVLAPTRELATQITATIEPLAAAYDLKVTTIYGGINQKRQVEALRAGVDIVVATPGRLEDLMQQGFAHLDAVEITVLDEADHMADLGFLPVVTRILDKTPRGGQRLLFSATLDNGVDKLVKRYLQDEVLHSVDEAHSPVAAMTHRVFLVDDTDAKHELVKTLASGMGRRILFMRTKHHAKKLAKKLTEQGIPAVDLHGNLSQPQRDRNLAAFGDGSVKVMVATDVAARGVHVDDVELVIHVDPPMEHKAYLHRSGRTARAGSEGDVVTIAMPGQLTDLKTLLRKAEIRVTPEPVSPASPVVTSLVGDVAPYVKPAPREAKPAPGGGRSQGANAQRKRAAREATAAGAGAGQASEPGQGRRSRGRGRGRSGQSDVAPATPRRDRSGRPAEAKAHAPKQGGGQSRGAQSTGAQRGASPRQGSQKAPLRVGSLVSPQRNTRTNRRAQG